MSLNAIRKAAAKITQVRLQLVAQLPTELRSCPAHSTPVIPRTPGSTGQQTLPCKTEVCPSAAVPRNIPSYSRMVCAPHSSVTPQQLGWAGIAGASKAPLCFPAQVCTGGWTTTRPWSHPSTVGLEAQHPRFHFSLMLFPEVKQWAEHQTCQQPWCGTSPSKHCWHSWNLLDGRKEASEKPQTQTSCFQSLALGIQTQVNKTLRWKSTWLSPYLTTSLPTLTKPLLICTLQQAYWKQWKICGSSKPETALAAS